MLGQAERTWKKERIRTLQDLDQSALMRAFVRLRILLASNEELARRLHQLEKKYDGQFKIVFEAIRQLMAPPEELKRQIGFPASE